MVHFQPFDPVHKRTEARWSGPRDGNIPGGQGRATGDPGDGGQAAEIGAQWRRRSTSFAARGFRSLGVARADERRLAVSGRLPSLRSAARRFPSHHRDRQEDGHERKDGHGRSEGDRPKEIAGQLGLGKNILDAGGLETEHQASARWPKRSRGPTASPRYSPSTSIA